MPAVLLDEAASPVKMAEDNTEKKHKRSKSEKKRPREEDDSTEPRKFKKSKKQEDSPDAVADVVPAADFPVENGDSKKKKRSKKQQASNSADAEVADAEVKDDKSKKSKKKSKKDPEADQQPDMDSVPEAEPSEAVDEVSETPKKSKKEKSKKKDKKRAESPAPAEDGESQKKSKKKRRNAETQPEAGDDAMDIDAPQQQTASKTSESSDPSFPFYTQTISLYVPFYPVGFDKPITNVAAQHLEPLLNHYSPLLGGVLLAYRNVNLSERPVRPNPKNLPDDHTPALLESVDEYAVGFGWLTADMDLFKPSRGAWMEGTVNLQSEGHIGVVCWNKFNASIEAKRLPAGWKWVDTTKNGSMHTGTTGQNTKITFGDDNEAEEAVEEESENVEEEPEKADTDVLDDAPLQLAELHTTGYWVDASGARVSSSPLRFRIKNFDVGIAGDFGYISIEGTTLGDEEERALGRQERELEQRRRAKQNPAGLLRPMLRRVPEFSLTSFGREDEEEDSNQKTVLYKGSRPGTPDD